MQISFHDNIQNKISSYRWRIYELVNKSSAKQNDLFFTLVEIHIFLGEFYLNKLHCKTIEMQMP